MGASIDRDSDHDGSCRWCGSTIPARRLLCPGCQCLRGTRTIQFDEFRRVLAILADRGRPPACEVVAGPELLLNGPYGPGPAAERSGVGHPLVPPPPHHGGVRDPSVPR